MKLNQDQGHSRYPRNKLKSHCLDNRSKMVLMLQVSSERCPFSLICTWLFYLMARGFTVNGFTLWYVELGHCYTSLSTTPQPSTAFFLLTFPQLCFSCSPFWFVRLVSDVALWCILLPWNLYLVIVWPVVFWSFFEILCISMNIFSQNVNQNVLSFNVFRLINVNRNMLLWNYLEHKNCAMEKELFRPIRTAKVQVSLRSIARTNAVCSRQRKAKGKVKPKN